MKDCYFYSSIAYLNLNQQDQTVCLLNEVISCDPLNIEALLVRSRAFEKQSKDLEATRDLQAAFQIDP
jgi:Tfp pilus assembly protein PilF